MASPALHALIGAGLGYFTAGDASLPLFASLRKAGWAIAAGAALACLADVDYVPGLLRGYMNTTHQQATHGIGWALEVALGTWLVGRALKPQRFGWRTLVLLLAAAGSHLAIDWITADHFAPYGFAAWHPFSGDRTLGPGLLPAWSKTTPGDLADWGNARALGVELLAGAAFAAGCAAAKRSWTRRRRAL